MVKFHLSTTFTSSLGMKLILKSTDLLIQVLFGTTMEGKYYLSICTFTSSVNKIIVFAWTERSACVTGQTFYRQWPKEIAHSTISLLAKSKISNL